MTLPVASGVLEMHPKGFGFLRNPLKHYNPLPGDAFVGQPLIRQFNLAEGVLLSGPVEPPARGTTGPRLLNVDSIEGGDPKAYRRNNWDELTVVDPTRHIKLETGAEPLTTRVMDLFTPIGFGQRGIIVAPPRTGKTVLLQHLAAAITTNYPQAKLMVLLVDERPEEVTEIRRTVKGEVVASTSDKDASSHIRLAELVLERGRRLAESGRDCVILLDSLTRLARAYNKQNSSGKTMSGGVDSRAMDIPKRLFGAARAFEEGGTLTIMGTALIETGSRMDDLIFQEFKGTGNMELILDRKLAERRVYPAIDLGASGTRKEERLIPADTLEKVGLLRRSLMQMKGTEAMEGLIKQMAKTKSNEEFLDMVSKFNK
ncbi:MAG: transcription termination factor Rho [Gemmataceae bacterium]